MLPNDGIAGVTKLVWLTGTDQNVGFVGSLLITIATCALPNWLSVGFVHAPTLKLTMPTPSADTVWVALAAAPALIDTRGANSCPLPALPGVGGPTTHVTVGEVNAGVPNVAGSSLSEP